MNFLKFAFFFALTVLFQGSTQAQDWVSYQSQQQINDLVDTGNELLMATDAGLVVMNKSNLEKTIFNKANTDLSNNHIMTITQAPNGNSWIGTYDAILARFDGTQFLDITMPEGDAYDQNTQLYDFKIAPNGDFWLGTSDGVFHRQGQTWSHYDQDEFGPSFFEAWDIEINSDGEVLVASHDIHKFADGTWTNLSETTELSNYLDADLFFSNSGDLFVAGDLDRIGRWDGTQWQEYEIDLNGSEVVGFTEDVDGNIYFNTQRDGIFKLENNTWTQQVDAQAQAFNNITPYFYIDAQNNRWLNSDIHLSVNKNGNIQTTLISQHTLQGDGLQNIHKGINGKMYFIVSSKNNFSVVDENGNWSFLSKPPMAMQFEMYRDMLVLGDNDIWLASLNEIYHYDGTQWEAMGLGGGLNFAMDSQGKIYIQTSNKIIMMDEGVMSEYNVDNSELSNLILSGIGIDAEDNIWISSFNWDGDYKIQKLSTDGTWTNYSSVDYPAMNRPGGDFYFDNDGNVWVSSDQVGALKFDGTDWTNPIMDNINLVTNYEANAIEGDALGTIYFSHQYGVTTLSNGEWGNLSIEDVPAVATSASTVIKFDDKGTLWWGSNRHGVFAYTTETTTAVASGFKTSTNFSIYPNPAKDYTILDFTIEATATVNVFIYNNLGQLQSSLDLGQLSAGTFQQRLDLIDLPKGIYAIQLQINDKSVTKLIIVS